MKKLSLIFALIVISFTIKSQEIPKATYKVISTEGYSEELNLLDTFYISVIEFIPKRTKSGFYFKVYSKTFVKRWASNLNVYSTIKYKNNNVPDMLNFPITNEELSLYTLPVIFNNTIRKYIEDQYGASNVSKLE